MGIGAKTRKMLWGRAANRCSYLGCRQELVFDETETDDPSVIGEECHINGKNPKSARHDPSLSPGKVDKYDNLILLCNIHHKKVDDQENHYTVDKLREMKKKHEAWVKDALSGYDFAKQRDDELYAGYVDKWAELVDLENWDLNFSSLISSGQPSIEIKYINKLKNTSLWIFKRVWPRRYDELEHSFFNFISVSQDLVKVFMRRAVKLSEGDETYWTEKFYRNANFDRDSQNRAGVAFDQHVDLVEDLALELTRSANDICEQVREFLLPDYRIQEGVITITSGLTMSLNYETFRPQYLVVEGKKQSYPGLVEFMRERESRDIHYGTGTVNEFLDIEDIPEFSFIKENL